METNIQATLDNGNRSGSGSGSGSPSSWESRERPEKLLLPSLRLDSPLAQHALPEGHTPQTPLQPVLHIPASPVSPITRASDATSLLSVSLSAFNLLSNSSVSSRPAAPSTSSPPLLASVPQSLCVPPSASLSPSAPSTLALFICCYCLKPFSRSTSLHPSLLLALSKLPSRLWILSKNCVCLPIDDLCSGCSALAMSSYFCISDPIALADSASFESSKNSFYPENVSWDCALSESTISHIKNIAAQLNSDFCWFDRICIDQRDTLEARLEKEFAVQNMGKSISNARFVLVLLEDVKPETIKRLKNVCSTFQENYVGLWGKGWSTDLKYEQISGTTLSSQQMIEAAYSACESWHTLEASQYWNQGWSVPYILLARQIVFVSQHEFIISSDLPDLNDMATMLERGTSKNMKFFVGFGMTPGADIMSRWAQVRKTASKLKLAETIALTKNRRWPLAQDRVYALLGLVEYGDLVTPHYTPETTLDSAAADLCRVAVNSGDVSFLTFIARPKRPKAQKDGWAIIIPELLNKLTLKPEPKSYFPDMNTEQDFLDIAVLGRDTALEATASSLEVDGALCGPLDGWSPTQTVLSRNVTPVGELCHILGDKVQFKALLNLMGITARVSHEVGRKCIEVMLKAYREMDPFVPRLMQDEFAALESLASRAVPGDESARMLMAAREMIADVDAKIRRFVDQTSVTLCVSNAPDRPKVWILLVGDVPQRFSVLDVGLTSGSSPIYVAATGADVMRLRRVGLTYKAASEPNEMVQWGPRV
ncbi:hypothetical protein HK096_001603, partial [Nowakowskiella sp. JEL0078]